MSLISLISQETNRAYYKYTSSPFIPYPRFVISPGFIIQIFL